MLWWQIFNNWFAQFNSNLDFKTYATRRSYLNDLALNDGDDIGDDGWKITILSKNSVTFSAGFIIYH